MNIKINDGRKTYNIQNQDGDIVGAVTFDPTDTNILRRKDAFLSETERLMEELKSIDKNSPENIVSEKEDAIKEKVNAFFNADVVTPFEKIRGLFSPSCGSYFIYEVLNGLFGIVSEAYAKETKAAENRMAEYLEEYTEGAEK